VAIDSVIRFAPAVFDATAPDIASPVNAALGEKFGALMRHRSMVSPEHANSHLSSTVSKAVGAQDAQFQRTVADLDKLTNDMPELSLHEMTNRSIQMMFEMTSMQINMQVKMSLAESSKSSVQTLMKNQ
jgi:type III secretion inner rod protein HrpB2